VSPDRAPRADLGSEHAITPAGRAACALAATRHGVYALLDYGLLPRCATCPEAVARLCPERPDDLEQSCPLLARFRAQMHAELAPLFEGAGGYLRACDRPLVTEYVKQLTLLLRIDMILEAEGLERAVVRDGARTPGEEPEVVRRGRMMREKELLEKLRAGKGLSPAEQAELKRYEEARAPKPPPGQAYAVKAVGLDLHALVPLRETVSGKVFAYAEQLGLSPMGRLKLGLDGERKPAGTTLEGIARELKESAGGSSADQNANGGRDAR
jgi:hypothetical protein